MNFRPSVFPLITLIVAAIFAFERNVAAEAALPEGTTPGSGEESSSAASSGEQDSNQETTLTENEAPISDSERSVEDNHAKLNISALLGLTNLTINPKVISRTDGGDTTFGVDYSYHRRIYTFLPGRRTELDLSIHSEGLVVPDKEKSPTRLLEHGVRLSLIDLSPSKRIDNAETEKRRALNREIFQNNYIPWQQDRSDFMDESNAPNERAEAKSRMEVHFLDAKRKLANLGELEADIEEGDWYMRETPDAPAMDFGEFLMQDVVLPRKVFLSFDFDGDLESDQSFSDMQLVGSGLLRGQLVVPFFDYPFALIRGYKEPKSHLNTGGPYFWGGAGLVDPSSNQTRREMVGDDDIFGRAEAGAFYRTELFGFSETKTVSAELSWRYYHEFDAPHAIEEANLDETSYFKATILFPENIFIQYTNGKLPLDVERSETVSGGWRFSF